MPFIRKVGQSAEEYAQIIEKYRIQNPVKYAAKEAALLAKLASLQASEAPEKPKKK